ncbi:MAG: hypothetical protein HUU06_05910 [Planctomycetaceae bacterium]|nr:hypothetical protein [Planctomycetaceae bacterium]
MIGALVPVAMLPRFTSHVGAGTFATVPMDVQAFDKAHLVFWRGPLVGGSASNPFRLWFEESHDATVWTEAAFGTQPLTEANTTANAGLKVTGILTKRWFRVRVVLAGDANGVVGITLWLTGALEMRVS